MTWRIYSDHIRYGLGRRLAIIREERDGGMTVLRSMEMKRFEPNVLAGEDERDWTLSDATLGDNTVDTVLQALLDHAWELGMRPKGFADTTEQVKAMKDHLNDMRALVFKGKEPPMATASGSQRR